MVPERPSISSHPYRFSAMEKDRLVTRFIPWFHETLRRNRSCLSAIIPAVGVTVAAGHRTVRRTSHSSSGLPSDYWIPRTTCSAIGKSTEVETEGCSSLVKRRLTAKADSP